VQRLGRHTSTAIWGPCFLRGPFRGVISKTVCVQSRSPAWRRGRIPLPQPCESEGVTKREVSNLKQWDSDPRMTALARANSNCKRQTRPRQRKRPTSTNPQLSDSNKNVVVSPRWALYSKTDWLTDSPSVVTRLSYEGEMSTRRDIQAGVPQGSILSPTLYDTYVGYPESKFRLATERKFILPFDVHTLLYFST
jgi:hypothetical protein